MKVKSAKHPMIFSRAPDDLSEGVGEVQIQTMAVTPGSFSQGLSHVLEANLLAQELLGSSFGGAMDIEDFVIQALSAIAGIAHIGSQRQVTPRTPTSLFQHLNRKGFEGDGEAEIAVAQVLSMGVVPIVATTVEEVLRDEGTSFREWEIGLDTSTIDIICVDILGHSRGEKTPSQPSHSPFLCVDSAPHIEEIEGRPENRS